MSTSIMHCFECMSVGYAGGPSAESKTIIVRNLSYDTTEDELKDAFDGALTCRVMTHAESGKSKGFVSFYDYSHCLFNALRYWL